MGDLGTELLQKVIHTNDALRRSSKEIIYSYNIVSNLLANNNIGSTLGKKNDKLTFICLEKTFEWKQMCQAETYIRPWYKNDLSSAQE